MIVLVDTTVWIDFFSAQPTSHVQCLENLINEREDLCVCGIILTEVLQGIRKDTEYRETIDLFRNLIFLPMHYTVFLRAAEIYRKLRRKRITIRRSLDSIIASVAIEHNIPLLHNDKDFMQIEKHSNLKVFC
jgi:hypothetical protein